MSTSLLRRQTTFPGLERPFATAIFLAATFFSSGVNADSQDREDAFFDITFEEAQAKARAERKLVMIDFFTTWCAPCRQMDVTTFRDPEVTAWLRAKTVPIRVDADQNAELKGRYKVNQYPTFVFTSPVGHQRSRLVGFRDALTFLAEAKDALAGAGELGRARTRFLAAQDDPRRRRTYAAALIRAENYPEALKHYLWYLDHRPQARDARNDTNLTRVLADIAHLSDRFPAARTELLRRRDQLAATITLDGGSPEQIRDLVAIDETGLGEPSRTLALYDRLVATGGGGSQDARPALGEALRPALMGAQRYADVARDLGDPASRFDEYVATYQKQVAAAEGLPAALRNQAADAQRSPVIQFGFVAYEVLLGTGEHQQAARMATRLLDFDPNPEARKALISIAKRLSDKKAAAALAAGG